MIKDTFSILKKLPINKTETKKKERTMTSIVQIKSSSMTVRKVKIGFCLHFCQLITWMLL